MSLPDSPAWPEDQPAQPTALAPAAPPVSRPRPARAAAPLLVALSLAVLADSLTGGAGTPLGLNLPVWVAVFTVVLLTVLRRQGQSPSREGITLLVSAFALSLLFVVRDAPAGLSALNFLALLLALMLGAAHLRFPGLGLSGVAALLGTAFTGGLRFLYGPLALLERFPWQRYRFAAASGPGRGLGVGALLTLPVLLVFGSLLSSADASFAGVVNHLFAWNLGQLPHQALTFLWWFAVAGGLVYPALLASRPSHLALPPNKLARLGFTEIALPLASLAALFVLFLALQLPYLLSGTLPEGLTFSEYIRKGFGELMTVAFLTLGLLLGAHSLIRADLRTQLPYRLLNLAVLAPLALVLLSAANRWRLYHLAYGLSETRVLGAAFLVWMVGCLGWLTSLLWRGDLRRFAYPALLMGFMTLWTTTLLSPGNLIARTNIHRQLAGVTNDLRSTPQQAQVGELLNLGADAVPAVVQHLAVLTAPCGPTANCLTGQDIINRLHDEYDPPRDPRAWNASYARAHALVQQLPPPTPHGRDSSD